jgi:hypothetical protein
VEAAIELPVVVEGDMSRKNDSESRKPLAETHSEGIAL